MLDDEIQNRIKEAERLVAIESGAAAVDAYDFTTGW